MCGQMMLFCDVQVDCNSRKPSATECIIDACAAAFSHTLSMPVNTTKPEMLTKQWMHQQTIK
jgi:hypothetical protein